MVGGGSALYASPESNHMAIRRSLGGNLRNLNTVTWYLKIFEFHQVAFREASCNVTRPCGTSRGIAERNENPLCEEKPLVEEEKPLCEEPDDDMCEEEPLCEERPLCEEKPMCELEKMNKMFFSQKLFFS